MQTPSKSCHLQEEHELQVKRQKLDDAADGKQMHSPCFLCNTPCVDPAVYAGGHMSPSCQFYAHIMVLHQPEHVSSDQGISMLNAQNSLTAA